MCRVCAGCMQKAATQGRGHTGEMPGVTMSARVEEVQGVPEPASTRLGGVSRRDSRWYIAKRMPQAVQLQGATGSNRPQLRHLLVYCWCTCFTCAS